MKRRELLLLVSAALIAARALAQQKAIPVIGLLGSGSPFVRAGYLWPLSSTG
jgi:hypothetical protein